MNYLESFQTHLSGRKFPLTCKAYTWTISHYLEYCDNKPTQENAAKFLNYLSVNCGGRSLNRHLAALRSFFSNILKQKLEIEPYRFIRKLPVWINFDDQKKLIAACKNPMDRAIIICALGSGLRLSEMANMKVGDINPVGFIKTLGKGGKERVVSVPEELVTEIDSYLKLRKSVKSSDRVFPVTGRTIERIVAAATKRAKLSVRVTPHTLRHSFASAFLSSGGELLHLREQLGHTSIAVTNIYLHCMPEQIRERMPNVLEGKI